MSPSSHNHPSLVSSDSPFSLYSRLYMGWMDCAKTVIGFSRFIVGQLMLSPVRAPGAAGALRPRHFVHCRSVSRRARSSKLGRRAVTLSGSRIPLAELLESSNDLFLSAH